MKKQLFYSNPRYYKLLKKYRNLYSKIKEMLSNGTFFQLEIRARKSLSRKFKLLYSRLNKIQLSTGLKTAGVAMAFTLISSIASGQNIARKWVENPQGTAIFNSSIYVGNQEIATFVDIDGDGDEDMFLGGNKGSYVYKFYRNQGINADERFVFADHTVDTLGVLPFISNTFTIPAYLAFIDNDNDNDLDIYATDPAYSGSVVYYKNTSNADTLRFKLTTGTENRFSSLGSIHSIAFADIDADNNIDALFMTESDTIRYFEHSADTFIEQLGTNNPFAGLELENPTMDFRDLDGDNDIDAIAHDCNDLVFLENTINNGRQQFTINTTDTIIRGIRGHSLFPVFADLNQDNEDDFFISDYEFNTKNNFYYYQYNTSDSTFSGSASGLTIPIHNFTDDVTRFIDFDNDGDLDLYLDNIANFYPLPNRLFINAGTATNPKFQQTALEAFGIPYFTNSTEAFADIDDDGDLDLFKTNFSNPMQMYKNVGSVAEPNYKLQDAANNPLSGINGSNEPYNLVFEDIDSDGDLDLVTAIYGQSPFVKIYENTGTATNAVFSQTTLSPDPFSSYSSNNIAYTLEFYDFDDDNKKDLIVGIHSTNPGVYQVFRNTSTNTNISFELMDEAPLADLYSARGIFALVNLFGENTTSLVLNQVVGLGNSIDTISYYNYLPFLTINQQTYSVDERSAIGTLVGRINYNYIGDSTLTFSITGGNTDNAFQITGDSITVQSPTAINYNIVANRTFNIIVQINDGADSVYTNYTVNINNIPLFFYDKTLNVEERLPTGTAVGHINSDYDGTGTVTYSITGGNTDNAFAVEGDSIVVQNASALNYDIVANRTFNLTLEATDGTSTETATYTINLIDITLRIHDRTYLMYHTSTVGTIVGEIDAEYYGTDTLELSILAGNTADAFEIIDSNIVVKTANALDYSIEANRTFNLTIEAREDDTDTITETANYTINITLNLINLEARTYAIDEGSATGTVVGQIVSSYLGTGTISYSITQGNTNNAFQLDGTNIVVQNSEALNYDIEANRTFNLTIEATDGTETITAIYTININDVATAINNTNKQNLVIYPNPAQDELNIEIDNNLGNKVLLKLIDNSGTIVYKQIAFANTTVQINTSELESGIYFVEIISDNKKTSKKVIIE